MDEIFWWKLLRTKLREVHAFERRRWTDADLLKWLVSLRKSSELANVKEALPPLATVRRMCADLIGPRAPD